MASRSVTVNATGLALAGAGRARRVGPQASQACASAPAWARQPGAGQVHRPRDGLDPGQGALPRRRLGRQALQLRRRGHDGRHFVALQRVQGAVDRGLGLDHRAVRARPGPARRASGHRRPPSATAGPACRPARREVALPSARPRCPSPAPARAWRLMVRASGTQPQSAAATRARWAGSSAASNSASRTLSARTRKSRAV